VRWRHLHRASGGAAAVGRRGKEDMSWAVDLMSNSQDLMKDRDGGNRGIFDGRRRSDL
jgi:hypothetical protein